MKLKKALGLIMACTMALTVFTGCGNTKEESKNETTQEATDTSWEDLKSKGTLKIGMCPEYPPFESINDSGEIEGFDVDLATAIGEEMGIKVEFANIPWEGLISGLNNSEFDMIMSAMSPEEASAAKDSVELSDNYYDITTVMAVRADDDSIKAKEDLTGKTIGYQTGSSSEQVAAKLKDMGIEVKAENPYNRNSDAFADLENGRIDAVIVSFPYAVTQSKEDKNFKVVNDAIDKTSVVAVVKKGSKSIIEEYNKALKTVRDSGKYKEIERKWLSVE